jgi:hypothetical protein
MVTPDGKNAYDLWTKDGWTISQNADGNWVAMKGGKVGATWIISTDNKITQK